MDYYKVDKAAKIISQSLLTPVIYMRDYGDWTEFVCFCDGKVTVQDIYDTEQRIKELVGIDAEIVDIREFSEAERIEIINEYELIHSENPLTEKLFAMSMMTDYKRMIDERSSLFERKRESGTHYIQ